MTQRQRFLTPQGRDQLQQELDVLRTVRRPDVAARIHQATEGGGTVDNAEYEEVKNEQAFVEGRIRDLEEILANAVVAERSPDAEDQVQFRLRRYRQDGSRPKSELPACWERGSAAPRRQDLERVPGRPGSPGSASRGCCRGGDALRCPEADDRRGRVMIGSEHVRGLERAAPYVIQRPRLREVARTLDQRRTDRHAASV